jgi:signal transduction histidine kinase
MSNIKMAIKMLEINLKRLKVLDAESHPIDRYFQILKDECQRETNLINDLLDLSLLDGGTEILEFTTVKDLPAWILHIAEPFIERAQNQQQSLQFNLPAELPVLSTDFSYLERILIELLNNACKYTPTGETIRVSACITADLLNLSVANSGIEIRESEQTRIFDKFYRIPHHDPWKFGGTGLGLALVKKRVEQLQGTIEVTSEQGWTIFTVKIPLVTVTSQSQF